MSQAMNIESNCWITVYCMIICVVSACFDIIRITSSQQQNIKNIFEMTAYIKV